MADPAQPRIEREAGRRAFGADPSGYDRARPEYPDRVWELLASRCGLAPGCRTLEIGAGTGLATRQLLARGARPLVAIEPDERLADFLQADLSARGIGGGLELRRTTLEACELPAARFDLAVCATAFHWIEAAPGLARVANALRPGGWWAMWWTVFGDPDRPDAFHEASVGRLSSLSASPSVGVSWRAPYALDEEARLLDLAESGAFDEIAAERVSDTLRLAPDELRSLYATFSSLNVQPRDVRERLLDEIERIAVDEFGGLVERPLLTAIYTARRR